MRLNPQAPHAARALGAGWLVPRAPLRFVVWDDSRGVPFGPAPHCATRAEAEAAANVAMARGRAAPGALVVRRLAD